MNISDNYKLVQLTTDQKQQHCLICHCEYVSTDKILEINKCQHIFHVDCIEQWFEYSKACPICREPFQTHQPNLIQYLLILLSVHQSNSSPISTASVYQNQSLSHTAFVCVLLHILLSRYQTAQEFNYIKDHLTNIRNTFSVDGEIIPPNLNLNNRTSIQRELRYRQTLLRSQLLQWLWTEQDPYHIDDPPILQHGNRLYGHYYLVQWREKIERAFDNTIST